jgi:CDP-paratose 2-epimerase
MAKDKETLLITGGLGFIGSNLAKKLCNKFKIVVVDFGKSLKAEEVAKDLKRHGVRVIISNIASPKTWQRMPKCQYIFHAAAQVAAEVSWKMPELDFRTNSYGTFLVARHALKHNASIIYSNSIRVYYPEAVAVAMKQYGKVSEKCATIDVSNKPLPPFAISKYLGEQCLRYYYRMHGLRVISHRMSGVVGAGQVRSNNHGWLTNIVHCAVKNKEFTLFGDGNQTRDIMHVNDFLDLIEDELEDFQKYSEGGFAVYNVGGGPANELSINQVIKILERDFSYKMKLTKAEPRIGEPRRYATDNSRIRKKGWHSDITDIRKIIKELIDWYKGG